MQNYYLSVTSSSIPERNEIEKMLSLLVDFEGSTWSKIDNKDPLKRESEGISADADFISQCILERDGGWVFGKTIKKSGFNINTWSKEKGGEFHLFMRFKGLEKDNNEIGSFLKHIAEKLSAYYAYFDFVDTVATFSKSITLGSKVSKIKKLFRFTYLNKEIIGSVDKELVLKLNTLETDKGVLIDVNENNPDVINSVENELLDKYLIKRS